MMRDDNSRHTAGEDREKVTWGDVWKHCSLSGQVSRTKAATALEAHPDSGYHNHNAARDRIQAAVADGELVATGPHGTTIAIEEDASDYV